MIKKVLILSGLVCLAGCMPHFKDADSYGTLFREGEAPPTGKGDPYTFGGIAEGSGGQMPRTSYADDSGIADFRDATSTGKLGQIDKERVSTPEVHNGGVNLDVLPSTRDGKPVQGTWNSPVKSPDSAVVEIPGATNVEPPRDAPSHR